MPFKNVEDYRAYQKVWRNKNREHYRERLRAYRKRNAKTINAQRRSARNRPREYAQNKFRFAVKRGWINGHPGKVFHHPDYSRPYYGVWLTHEKHMNIHAGNAKCPPCRDYSRAVEKRAAAARAERNSKGGSAACAVRWGGLTAAFASLDTERKGHDAE